MYTHIVLLLLCFYFYNITTFQFADDLGIVEEPGIIIENEPDIVPDISEEVVEEEVVEEEVVVEEPEVIQEALTGEVLIGEIIQEELSGENISEEILSGTLESLSGESINVFSGDDTTGEVLTGIATGEVSTGTNLISGEEEFFSGVLSDLSGEVLYNLSGDVIGSISVESGDIVPTDYENQMLNNGSMANTIIATITGDTFASNIVTNNLVQLTGTIPTGLTPYYTLSGNSQLIIGLTGNAISHTTGANTSGVVVRFLTGAFATYLPIEIGGSYQTGINIEFYDGALIGGQQLWLKGAKSGTQFFDSSPNNRLTTGYNGISNSIRSGETVMGMFDGVDDYISVGNYTLTNYSVSIRLQSTINDTEWRSAFGSNSTTSSPMEIVKNNTNYLEFYAHGRLTSTFPLQSGMWYHVVLVQTSTGTQMYIDGQYNTGSASRSELVAAPLEVGSDSYYDDHRQGRLDEAQVFDSPLTFQQIDALYMKRPSYTGKTVYTSTPTLTGDMPDPLMRSWVTISGVTYTGTNNQDGTRTLSDIGPLSGETYDVQLDYMNVYGKTGTSFYTGGLIVVLVSDVPQITGITLLPDLNASRFNDYGLSAILSGNTIISGAVELKGINGDGGNCIHYYASGSCIPTTFTYPLTYSGGQTRWTTDIRPDQIYPQIFFAPSSITRNNPPDTTAITRNNYALFHMQNDFSMIADQSFWIELNTLRRANNSVSLSVYLVEKGHDISYFNSNWLNATGVELVGTITNTMDFDHEHTENSQHHLVALSTNADGTVGNKNIDISDDFWIVLYPNTTNTNRGRDLRYQPSSLCENINGRYAGNQGAGRTTTAQSGCPDAHVHLARKAGVVDGVNAVVKTTYFDGYSTGEISGFNNFYFGAIPNMPPNATSFISPISGIVYSGTIDIARNPATDPNNDSLMYNIYLLDATGTVLQTLITGISVTGYQFISTTVSNGFYGLKGEVCDGQYCVDFYTDDNFEIHNMTGSLSISGPVSFEFGERDVSDQMFSIEKIFSGVNDYFQVIDEVGADTGYYTTISISDMTNGSGDSIASGNIAIKALTGIITLDGTDNPRVYSAITGEYQYFTATPLTFIRRDTSANGGVIGTYGLHTIWKIDIPVLQNVGDYTGVITYTLYD